MSEKNLREYVKQSIANHHSSTGARVIEAMLAEEPDVVKVLRWLRELTDDAVLPQSIKRALTELSWTINERLHIRLTDGGWEYTDDGHSS